MTTSSAILAVQGLTKRYGTGDAAVHAVEDVTLDIRRGEIVVIMGPSGSGKTTLLSMMGGLMRPTSGEVFLEETGIWTLPEAELAAIRAHRIGFIFQAFNLLGALTVEENILLPAQLAPGGVRGAGPRMEELVRPHSRAVSGSVWRSGGR